MSWYFWRQPKNSAVDAIELSNRLVLQRVGSDSISEEDQKNLVKAGIKVTRFAYSLENASLSIVEGALATVEEHHPHETIWLAAILGHGMKKIQVIDGAASCVYDIFAATETASRLDPVFERIWRRPIPKCDAVGIHRILFYQLDEKKQYYPTRRDEKAMNPDGSALRARRRWPDN